MIIIGEKINATRKRIAEAILSRDREAIKEQIENQDNAGAHYIDLNAGTGSGDEQQEIDDMCWLIDIALETTEKALSIDSANPKIIQKAVDYLHNRRPWLINSVKNEKHILEQLLPLAAQYKASIIALAMDAEGIPETVEQRLEVCRSIYEQADKVGVLKENIFFDPLVIPLSSNRTYGSVTLETLRTIKIEFPDSKTTMGISNVSFGLLKRARINEAFLIAAIVNGLDSAICDPTKEGIRKSILLGELIAGKDKYCRRYNRAVRKGDFDKSENQVNQKEVSSG